MGKKKEVEETPEATDSGASEAKAPEATDSGAKKYKKVYDRWGEVSLVEDTGEE